MIGNPVVFNHSPPGCFGRLFFAARGSGCRITSVTRRCHKLAPSIRSSAGVLSVIAMFRQLISEVIEPNEEPQHTRCQASFHEGMQCKRFRRPYQLSNRYSTDRLDRFQRYLRVRKSIRKPALLPRGCSSAHLLPNAMFAYVFPRLQKEVSGAVLHCQQRRESGPGNPALVRM
jgi:hypothetical protein